MHICIHINWRPFYGKQGSAFFDEFKGKKITVLGIGVSHSD
jgi:hypothetical protein